MKPHLVDFSLNSKQWVLAFLPGQRTKNGSADTLKKQCAGLFKNMHGNPPLDGGFVQVLPSRVAVSPVHVEWAGFALIQSMSEKTLHFRQSELEFVARVAGTFQWKDVLEKISLRNDDKNVVLVWMSPRENWSEKDFARVAREWGFSPGKWPAVSMKDEVFALERSALAGLE